MVEIGGTKGSLQIFKLMLMEIKAEIHETQPKFKPLDKLVISVKVYTGHHTKTEADGKWCGYKDHRKL